jgi:hypothetical protein
MSKDIVLCVLVVAAFFGFTVFRCSSCEERKCKTPGTHPEYIHSKCMCVGEFED